jgi:two-component system sensor histidine kinase/response regulator
MNGKVLIIDDDDGLREALMIMVEQAGFEVRGAGSVPAAWDEIFRFNPDLVVSDINMKPVDGFELLAMIRKHPDIAHLPVIIMTVESARARIRKGMQLGADDYLDKPFASGELVAAIRTQLGKRQQVRTAIDKHVQELRNNISAALPHEFNTPLAAIMGLAEVILEDTKLPDSVRQLADGIMKASQRLHRLTNNFLLYAQCEQLAQDPAAVAELRQESLSATQGLLADHARAVARHVGRTGDLVLELADGGAAINYLAKIQNELLDNAFKYSPPGKPVVVKTSIADGRFMLSISDQGHGFPAAAAREIGAFRQFDRKLREQQGAGFGLVIARRLAEMHSGQLRIESQSGGGTTVVVALPTPSLK